MNKIKETLKTFLFIFGVVILSTPFVLSSCDAEYDYQQAKYNQWEKDRKADKPFTEFNH